MKLSVLVLGARAGAYFTAVKQNLAYRPPQALAGAKLIINLTIPALKLLIIFILMLLVVVFLILLLYYCSRNTAGLYIAKSATTSYAIRQSQIFPSPSIIRKRLKNNMKVNSDCHRHITVMISRSTIIIM